MPARTRSAWGDDGPKGRGLDPGRSVGGDRIAEVAPERAVVW